MRHNMFRVFTAVFVLLSLLQPYCKSREVRYADVIELLYDNFWIDNDTLQIQVEGADNENIPYTMRRENACQSAKNNIDEHFSKLYPGRTIQYQKTIYKRLYTDKNNCRLVVHLYLQNFKEKIK